MNLLVLRFLTMNTEDERRDEAEAQLAARGLVRVDGGNIVTATDARGSGGGGGAVASVGRKRRSTARPLLTAATTKLIETPSSSCDSDFEDELVPPAAVGLSTTSASRDQYRQQDNGADASSVCSCSCYQLPYDSSANVVRHRYSVKRRPVASVAHLMTTHSDVNDERQRTREVDNNCHPIDNNDGDVSTSKL
jgi:hypothetical protein